MRAMKILRPLLLLSLALASCTKTSKASAEPPVVMDPVSAPAGSAQSEPEPNALLEEWKGPYGGVPGFDHMDLDDLEPAMKRAMELHLRELEDIASNPEPATFENTIVAIERTGEVIDRVETYYGIWRSNLSTPELREIEGRLAPLQSEYYSAIVGNQALFRRVEAVHRATQTESRTPAEQRLVKLVYDRFARQGAMLQGAERERYVEIQRRLAELHTQFGNNVLADEEGYVLYLKEDQTAGLPDSFKAAAAAAAKARGHEGEYAITNTRSSMDPFLTYCPERGLREQVWRRYYDRGDNGDEHDNNAIIAEILKLRDERVALLGYEDYASWRLEDRMAKSPARARELMMAVWPAALARAKQEVADMQAVARKQGAKITIAPWDYRFYADVVRKQKYALDSDEVKQYLQLDRLREAMFMVAGELFEFGFEPVPEGTVPVFHPDVKVWEVKRRDTGELVGLWYLDPFARPGKRSGAWANTYRSHAHAGGTGLVLASNNSNFIKGAPGQPVLVSWDDAETFFHEFGHALHSLSSNVEYSTLEGGVRDYTEFQSQLLERWLLTDAVVSKYLVHHQTGKPMPPALVAKIRKAATFNQGFATAEYLASAIIDLELHTLDPEGLDPDAFERETLARLGLPPQIVMRHRTPHFGHVFSGEGYAAGYYGYLWADVLTADAAEAFEAAPGGMYDRELATKLVERLFAPRNAVDPEQAYRAFRGRDATIDALMRDRGFPTPKAKAKTAPGR
ncbi:M3 family metallopeptidase [Paraliomyxa miuraensis]|uniref:M3 family metallopeptidase n=1 Tax=Paraliomyxa miuraensis TaxID=376150 RepID=UPI0022582243|nr:M3 family metallopeptidase [Paraliomyxa miuraensis]MCX4245371.1 M3 family metallopeptidase [Paraliomyxa miuraensis]